MKTNVCFVDGVKVGPITLRPIPKEILEQEYPGCIVVEIESGEVLQMRQPVSLVDGVITEAPPPTAEEISEGIKAQLLAYADKEVIDRAVGKRQYTESDLVSKLAETIDKTAHAAVQEKIELGEYDTEEKVRKAAEWIKPEPK